RFVCHPLFESRRIPTLKHKLNAYGECRVLASPMARLQKKKQAAVTTGSAGTSGIPCAMAYGLYALSSGTGLIAPVSRRRAMRVALGASTGAPGPRDFAVHESIARPRKMRAMLSRPPHCRSNVS
ncbi:hypothetical protein, partial [Bradyrhizobium sp. SZCCHNR3027]|uniref:hypothetical protein n=1 Tax=Bradyrhizobium sp. SZCCHNR3027 TaxID=3057402 RepID=UPI0028E8F8A0